MQLDNPQHDTAIGGGAEHALCAPSTENSALPAAAPAPCDPPASDAPVNLGGAPENNLNRAKSAKKLRPLAIGGLPKPMQRTVERPAQAYRRYLESECERAGREVGCDEHHLIDEAVGQFILDYACRWLLRTKFDSMDAAEIRLNCESAADAKAARNKIVAKLGLSDTDTVDGDGGDDAADLYRQPLPVAAPVNAAGAFLPRPEPSKPLQANGRAQTLPRNAEKSTEAIVIGGGK